MMDVLSSLPDKRYYEYGYHKFFNPEATYERWKPHPTWTYPDIDLFRFKHIITDQSKHYNNKKVLDLGCHIGYLSLFCLHNQASHVTGTNVRDRELSIAKEVCSVAGYSNFNFVNSDINNLAELGELCDQVDTVLMSVIIYHVNNHMEILRKIANSNAKTLIIESEVHFRVTDIPSIIFKHEKSSKVENGWDQGKEEVFVGIPNTKWLEESLTYLGYNITYKEFISFISSTERDEKRVIIVGEK